MDSAPTLLGENQVSMSEDAEAGMLIIKLPLAQASILDGVITLAGKHPSQGDPAFAAFHQWVARFHGQLQESLRVLRAVPREAARG